MKHSIYILLISVFLFRLGNGQEKLESFCNVNGDYALQQISEKFLSISIDPAVLLAGLNLSDASLLLAQSLSPAYIRIAGPSTKFVHYQDNEDRNGEPDDGNNVVVTPSMWFGVNEWLRLANLTPVFGINDAATARGVWNPKSTLPLLEISDKLNVSCFWQLGFDTTQKTEMKYKQDLNILYHILSAFPERNQSWKIIGSDISTLPNEHIENTMEELRDITTAVMWEPQAVTEDSFPEKDMGWKILRQQHKPNVKIWTSVPKSSETISFQSALLWARQVGDAAKFGYDVIFRQPRLHEIFSDTPAYWFSILHKKLMGSNVLDTKTSVYYQGCSTYAHCTKKDDDAMEDGALTVMIVNNNLQKYKAKLKLGTTPLEKNMRVLSYILTSPSTNSTEIYLNGKKLTTDFLSDPNAFQPKQRRTKSKSYVALEVPPQSIGFFVLPDAKIPICQNEKRQTKNNSILIADEQNAALSEEKTINLASRGLFVKNPTLQDMAQRMKKEMESDREYYKHDKTLDNDSHSIESTTHSARKSFIEKAKLAAKERKRVDLEKRKDELRKFLSEKTKATSMHKPETRMQSNSKNLELTSNEVERILKDRAKARAAQRNIIFTDEELDALLQKATKPFLKSRVKKPAVEESRKRRDINMHILEKQLNMDTPNQSINTDSAQVPDMKKRQSEYRKERSERNPRDINSRLLDLRSKLAENKQRMEDKRYEILGNSQTIKDNILDKIRDLKYKNKNRFRRDINMDLLKIKTEGQKKLVQKPEEKKFKSLFKNKENKEATIRRPDQTSAELLEELLEEEETPVEEPKVMPKIEVYAELADPEDDGDEEDVDFFNTNNKAKKSGRFDKKLDPFSIVNPTQQRATKTKKSKKEKNALEENLQFLTTSEEFTDIEDDLPCIHEYFGSKFKDTLGKNNKKVVYELGEVKNVDRRLGRGRQGSKKTAQLEDALKSTETDPFEELRMRRDTQHIELSSDKDDLKDVGSKNELMEESERQVGSKILVQGQQRDNDLNESHHLPHISSDDSKRSSDSDLSESGSFSESDSVSHQSESIEVKSALKSILTLPTVPSNGLKASNYHGDSGDAEDLSESEYTMKDKKTEMQSEEMSHGSTPATKVRLTQNRKKRSTEETSVADEHEHIPKIDIKQRIKDLKQHMLNDKLKFDEEKSKNKLKLAEIRKKHEGSKRKDKHILGEIHQNDQVKNNDILEQLQILKNILTEKKKEIDKQILNDAMKQGKLGKLKEKYSLSNRLSDITRTKAENKDPAQNSMSKEVKASLTEANGALKGGVVVGTEVKASPPMVHLSRRSLFDKYPGGFGNYKSLTENLKPWRPSDISSLKRDSSFLTSRLKPTNDYQLYTNMFDINRFKNLRKRSISNNFNDLDNYIGKDGGSKDENYIRTKVVAKKSMPVLNFGSSDYKKENRKVVQKENIVDILNMIPEETEAKSVPTNELLAKDVDDNVQTNIRAEKFESISFPNNESVGVNSGENGEKTNELTVSASNEDINETTVSPISYYTLEYVGTELQNETGNMENSTTSFRLLNMPKQAHDMLKNFAGGVTGFFKNMGSQIGYYLKHVMPF